MQGGKGEIEVRMTADGVIAHGGDGKGDWAAERRRC
jgi:hypothetical protein